MKHLISSIFSTLRNFVSWFNLKFRPKKAALDCNEKKRLFLMSQLSQNIETNTLFSKHGKGFSRNQSKITHDTMRKIHLQRGFLDAITNCPIEEFEAVASRWIRLLKK